MHGEEVNRLFIQNVLFFVTFDLTFFACIQGLDDPVMKSAAVDVFSYIVEFNPSMVREFILHEGQKQDDVRWFKSFFSSKVVDMS